MIIRVSGIEITVENWQGLSTRGRLDVLKTAAKIEESIIKNKKPASKGEKRTGSIQIFQLPFHYTTKGDER